MADNVNTTPGSGEVIAADDIGGAKYQRIKMIHGPDGINNGDVSSTNGLPVYIMGPSTAFDELEVAQPSPQFQLSFEYTVDNTELTTNVVTNGGTVTQAEAMAVVSTSITTASTARLQSKRHAKYRAGQGAKARFTTLFTSPVAATEQLAGIVDETGSSEAFKNGLTVGYIGEVFGFHRYVNDTLVTMAQSAWDDPLDGTGASGMTLDPTKLNVWEIVFGYLGVADRVLRLKSSITGKFITVHTENDTNTKTTPHSYNPNYHYTMWVDNKGTTSNLIVKTGSCAYFIEGKTDFINLHHPQFASGNQTLGGITTELAIFTIRNKATYASKTNFIDVLLEAGSAAIEAGSANNLGSVRLVRNATLGGTPSYSDINTTDSVVEIDTSGTTVTGGKELFGAQLAGKNDQEKEDFTPYKIILAPGETLTVAGVSASSATINAGLLWAELQ